MIVFLFSTTSVHGVPFQKWCLPDSFEKSKVTQKYVPWEEFVFFIPNSCVFSCWSQKTSKWVENITQTHSHSILIGPPTPTWFPFVVSLQARILFASKLISQKLLLIPNSCVFSCWSQKTSKLVENITQTHSHKSHCSADTYVISVCRFSSSQNPLCQLTNFLKCCSVSF